MVEKLLNFEGVGEVTVANVWKDPTVEAASAPPSEDWDDATKEGADCGIYTGWCFWYC